MENNDTKRKKSLSKKNMSPEFKKAAKKKTPLIVSAIWDRFPLTFTWNVCWQGKHSTQLIIMRAMPYPLSLCRRRRWSTESKALEKYRKIRSTALPSSSHFVINSSATRRLVRVERRGRKPCCRDVNNENWDKWARIFSLRIASSTLQTTDARLMGLNRFGLKGTNDLSLRMHYSRRTGFILVVMI